jgi:hypothetical protein
VQHLTLPAREFHDLSYLIFVRPRPHRIPVAPYIVFLAFHLTHATTVVGPEQTRMTHHGARLGLFSLPLTARAKSSNYQPPSPAGPGPIALTTGEV